MNPTPELDKGGASEWKSDIPTEPRLSKSGYRVPYRLSFLPLTQPRDWPYASLLYWPYAFGFVLPGLICCALILRLLCLGGRYADGYFARLVYRTISRLFTVTKDGAHQPVQVYIVFPGEGYFPYPIDVGIVEPVWVLNAMGLRTGGCCEGHGKAGYNTSYIGLDEGLKFPPSLYEALEAGGVRYTHCWYGEYRANLLHALTVEDNAAFCSTLKAWARERVPELF